MALSAMQERIKAYGLMGRSTGMQTKVGGSTFNITIKDYTKDGIFMFLWTQTYICEYAY